ncbi:MAG: hypothetical protein ACI8O8_002073, partial [Oleiphilaceae bacterium]
YALPHSKIYFYPSQTLVSHSSLHSFHGDFLILIHFQNQLNTELAFSQILEYQ